MDFERNTTPEGLSSDRLQKAILRNRTKQDRRSGLGQASLRSPSESTNKRLWGMGKPRLSKSSAGPSERAMARDTMNRRSALPNKKPALPGRRNSLGRQGVATPDTIKFTNGLDKVTKNKKSTLTKGPLPNRAKSSFQSSSNILEKPKWIKMLVFSGWCFTLFLLFRLVFAERGVIDFYSRKSAANRKEVELKLTILENDNLLKEIKLIKSNYRYQKKLVRDHLGYIAKDEYLLLFESDS